MRGFSLEGLMTVHINKLLQDRFSLRVTEGAKIYFKSRVRKLDFSEWAFFSPVLID